MAHNLKVKPETIGEFVARAAIQGNLSKQGIVAAVHANFPDSKTTLTTINWYIKQMRRAWYKDLNARFDTFPQYLGRKETATILEFKKK